MGFNTTKIVCLTLDDLRVTPWHRKPPYILHKSPLNHPCCTENRFMADSLVQSRWNDWCLWEAVTLWRVSVFQGVHGEPFGQMLQSDFVFSDDEFWSPGFQWPTSSLADPGEAHRNSSNLHSKRRGVGWFFGRLAWKYRSDRWLVGRG